MKFYSETLCLLGLVGTSMVDVPGSSALMLKLNEYGYENWKNFDQQIRAIVRNREDVKSKFDMIEQNFTNKLKSIEEQYQQDWLRENIYKHQVVTLYQDVFQSAKKKLTKTEKWKKNDFDPSQHTREYLRSLGNRDMNKIEISGFIGDQKNSHCVTDHLLQLYYLGELLSATLLEKTLALLTDGDDTLYREQYITRGYQKLAQEQFYNKWLSKIKSSLVAQDGSPISPQPDSVNNLYAEVTRLRDDRKKSNSDQNIQVSLGTVARINGIPDSDRLYMLNNRKATIVNAYSNEKQYLVSVTVENSLLPELDEVGYTAHKDGTSEIIVLLAASQFTKMRDSEPVYSFLFYNTHESFSTENLFHTGSVVRIVEAPTEEKKKRSLRSRIFCRRKSNAELLNGVNATVVSYDGTNDKIFVAVAVSDMRGKGLDRSGCYLKNEVCIVALESKNVTHNGTRLSDVKELDKQLLIKDQEYQRSLPPGRARWIEYSD